MKKKELLSQNTHLKKTIAELKHDMFKSKLEIAVDMLSGLGELELTDARETCRSGLGITRTLTFVLTINN